MNLFRVKQYIRKNSFFFLSLGILVFFIAWKNLGRNETVDKLQGTPIPVLSASVVDQLREQGIERIENRKILMVFFATWCGVCSIEAPILNSLKSRLDTAVAKDSLSADSWLIVGISEEDPQILSAYVKENQPSYPIIHDADGVLHDFFDINAYPTKIRIDQYGLIQDFSFGLNPLLSMTTYYWFTDHFF